MRGRARVLLAAAPGVPVAHSTTAGIVDAEAKPSNDRPIAWGKMMQRRNLVLGSLLASTSLSRAWAASDIKMIYIGGWD